MRKKLEFQADRIEAVLALHKVPARVTGGTVTPRWVRFQVLPAVGAKISKIKNLSEELAAALDAPSCRVSRRGAAVAVEVPRDDPQPVRLLPLYRQLTGENEERRGKNEERRMETRDSAFSILHSSHSSPIPPVTAILGLAEDGAPLLVRLPSPDVAHVLVAGTTGSGKTVLLQTMILSLAMTNPHQNLALVLIDPKGHAFGLFEGLSHLARPVIREVEEATEALQSLVRLMERQGLSTSRFGEGGSQRRGQPHPSPSRFGRCLSGGLGPSVVVVIDELADLLMVGGKAAQRALTRLTQRGREAGIHVVAATQKPTAAVLGPLVKANFPVRLVGRVTSVEDARTATGWSGTGAERLLGRGDFLAVAEGRVTRFQTAHVSPAEIREVVRRMENTSTGLSTSGGWKAGV
ncbi:MAG: DNA translocase FtsK [Anaerolineae bacterium]|nr:DNA translocase FtsK [Anaerolineae bacterium]